MLNTTQSVKIKDLEFEVLICEAEIKKRIKEVAAEIRKDYADKNPLLIGILNGSFIYAADLMRELDLNAEVSFIRVASYSGTQSTGDIKEVFGLKENIFNRDIIIVEDIIDSGRTIDSIFTHFTERGAKSVEVSSLLVKPKSLKTEINIKYKCFEITDEFVVGYGLDYDGYGRNLKEIYQLPQE